MAFTVFTFSSKSIKILVGLVLIISVSTAASLYDRPLHSDNHPARWLEQQNLATQTFSEWSNLGCYTDSESSRTLNSLSTMNVTSMTEQYCINFCASNGYPLAGVEQSQKCYCSKSIASSGSPTSGTDCNMACSGDPNQACGGISRINIFRRNSKAARAASQPVTNPGTAGWSFLGCYVDSVQSRTYPHSVAVLGGPQNMSTLNCVNACQSQGYQYAGTEYSGECYCGNALPASSAPDGLSGCSMPCNGNASEVCGGSNRLDIYGMNNQAPAATAWNYVGCYTDSVQQRSLPNQVAVPGGSANMTIPGCTAACQASGFMLAGLEYSQECWCGNVVSSPGGPAPDGSAGCNMPCRGNQSTICGGSNRLSLFSLKNSALSSSSVMTSTTSTNSASPSALTSTTAGTSSISSTLSSTSISTVVSSASTTITTSNRPSSTSANSTQLSTSISTTITSSSSTATSSNTSTSTSSISTSTSTSINGYAYKGCWIDNANGRVLTQENDVSSQTIESCIKTCQSSGYPIAGLEYSTQCFCGSSIMNGGALATSDKDCNMPCGGNSSEICGAGNRLSVYSSLSIITVIPVPTVQNSSLPGNWTYQGCLGEPQNEKVFVHQIIYTNNMTIPLCLQLCNQFGYSAGGVEYGSQCYCGDDWDRVNAGAQYLQASGCNMACPGAPGTLCGGPNAIQYYTQPLIDIWSQGLGNSAGEYEFLIGGVVIPLISQVAINNKVVMTEKHGTGPPNSTGSYEFDLSQVNNFTAAWRTLYGLKTDVFCSAGLTLPDKAGRIINIGGWSATSLFGVRFFTPSGSPGVPGTTEWQENVTEVSLQTGRWYPSVMQMVNGSILVVGGEDGANGAPVPSLEIIPQPPGGNLLYMDWLQRTDPNNLYPFLVVLPTGNIAVFYYNEARILDENTFATVRTLPNIPAAVDRPDGGRTYPLEGSSMLMPQYAPYTDPLTVLICGGSTPYENWAIDNCVSIQPEVIGQNWTIERMPSPRVVPCMAALPDGTYLILNGALHGEAGFGLATNPDHMAVLYDPSKPLHQRMTRMANTTIDRLYHSEAVLIPDGRVLVSGSDPEDNIHPEEYRLETFTPPYLMGNLASTRPVINLNGQTFFNYGQTLTFSVTSGSVHKISLMSAVASTHGNSMGQRTIFPAFSCGGSSCTVTMPPNGHVAGGPGWWMLFALNGNNTPSIGQWIRIGTDVANLGNWPNFPDFTLPGV